MSQSYRVLNLHVENIKKIKAVDITTNGNSVVISGKNGNGKSSTIDAIAWALGGAKLIPSEPVRHGEKQAEIVVDLGEIKVTRKWTGPDASFLKVEMQDGVQVSRPQSLLDSIVGNLTFDPLEFAEMQPKDRLALLKNLAGVDFEDLETERQNALADQRSLKKQLAGLNDRILIAERDLKDRGFVEIEMDEQSVRDAIDRIRDQELKSRTAEREKRFLEQTRDDLQKRIENLNRDLKLAQERLAQTAADLAAAESVIVSEPESTAAYEEMLEDHEKNRKLQTQMNALEAAKESFRVMKDTYEQTNVRLRSVREEKARRIENSNMPIKGLAFGEGEITFNDIPFGQLSSSEQIRVSMGIAMALNPKLRVALVKNGSLLDSEARKRLEEVAHANGFQVWIEVTSDGPLKDSIYIEDGEIK